MSASIASPAPWQRLTAKVTKAIFVLTHSSAALVGLAVVFAAAVLLTQPEVRRWSETTALSWLQSRQQELLGLVPDPAASERATAANPKALPAQQAKVAFWLSKRYDVAPEPVSALVSEAFEIGSKLNIEPTLILAVMAIESRFNPFAQSPVGAQGLMQVMTRVHRDKYEAFGGSFAAFDPLANLRVGVKVLQDCIRMAGSIEGGLRYYVGAAITGEDNGYVAKVLAEFDRLQRVSRGQSVPTFTPANDVANAKPAPSNPSATPSSAGIASTAKSAPSNATTVALN
ncbi:MAG: hypothetical protein Fur007_01180 [Rhodoferax sp.]